MSANSAKHRKGISILGWIAIFAIPVPLAMIVTGFTIASLIPRCQIGEGNGATGCIVLGVSLNPILEFLGLYGIRRIQE